jgi:hypothetical protein
MKAQRVLHSLVWLLVFQPLWSQEFVTQRDFLTDHEVDVIRESQEPNLRITHYLQFARLRLELVREQLANEKPGRSATIHRNLDEYGRIIETIDVVIDDALDDDKDVSDLMDKVVSEEDGFLSSLRQVADDPADDHFRYEFVLEDAIEITQDSIELAQQDLGKRLAGVRTADERERQKLEKSMTPALREETAKIKKKEEKKKRKRPTLLKPGETLGSGTKKK